MIQFDVDVVALTQEDVDELLSRPDDIQFWKSKIAPGTFIVKGFAITLALGVVINLFTAITVTRTFIRFVFDLAGESLRKTSWLLGICI